MKLLSFFSLFFLFPSAFAFDLNSLSGKISFPADLNHQQAFTAMAENLTQTGFIRSKGIVILYPGAGSHIAVLRLGQRLAELNPKIESLHFILTDIDDTALQRFRKYLDLLKFRNADITEKTEFRKTFLRGEEQTLSFRDQTLKVRFDITYALNRTDPTSDRDHEVDRDFYWAQTYMDEADIVISHDSSMTRIPTTFLTDFMISDSRSAVAKKKVFLMEDVNQGRAASGRNSFVNYDLLPGRVVTLPFPFGCQDDDPKNPIDEDHLGKPKYRGSIIYYANRNFWKKLSEYEIESFILLASTNTYPDTGAFNTDDYYFMLLNNQPAVLRRIITTLKKLKNDLAHEMPKSFMDHFQKQLDHFYGQYPIPSEG